MRYICEWCKNRFNAPPSQKARFCSRDCYDKSREGFFKCSQCGKIFKYYKSHKRGKQVFCSKECQREWQSIPNQHPGWKGGVINTGKYILIYKPEHPFSSSNYIRKHRLVMEEHLGRFLEPHEIIHHKNENTFDNRIENLSITTRKKHSAFHPGVGYQNGHKQFNTGKTHFKKGHKPSRLSYGGK